jgi:molybdopterin/thiamine biosynthesis adenylyltransferase/proteasome lid subunit RPN8/RPN11
MNQAIDELMIPLRIYNQAIKALSSSRLETVCFLFGKVKEGKSIATDILIPSESDYESRSLCHVYISPNFTLREFPRLLKQGKVPVAVIHSHPMKELSWGDINTHLNAIKVYPNQLSGVYCNGKLIFYRFEDGIKETPYRIIDTERFDRQIKIFGEEGQLLIASATIALIGVGGGNTKIAFDLASLGFGKLILIDPDVWEESNRNRVFIPPSHVGMQKVFSIKELIKEFYPDVQVEAYACKAEDLQDDVFLEADLITVGPDNIAARIFGNRLALDLNIPAIFPAAGIDVKSGKLEVMGGSVQVVVPGNSPCYECVHEISSIDIIKETTDPETKEKLRKKYSLGSLLDVPTAPSIAPLNDVIAGIALWEIVKLVTGIDKPNYFQVYDALKGELKQISISKKPNCPACSEIEEADANVETVDEENILNSKNWRG